MGLFLLCTIALSNALDSKRRILISEFSGFHCTPSKTSKTDNDYELLLFWLFF